MEYMCNSILPPERSVRLVAVYKYGQLISITITTIYFLTIQQNKKERSSIDGGENVVTQTMYWTRKIG